MKIIQVLGTNGKGSIAAYTANILSTAGFKTGLFISPHLIEKEERISIDGVNIPKEEFDELCEIFCGDNLFATYTDSAMAYFVRNNCEFAVLEAGLGGRLDPTTKFGAHVLIFGRIGLDHTQILGGTVEQIAYEKVAAIGYGVDVISVPQLPEVEAILREQCLEKHATLYFSNRYIGELQNIGVHQSENAGAAALAAQIAAEVSESQVTMGLKNTVIHGRIEYFGDLHLIIDGAHNSDAFIELADTLSARFPGRKKRWIVAAMGDKDISKLVEIVGEDECSCVCADEKRGVAAKNLAAKFKNGKASALSEIFGEKIGAGCVPAQSPEISLNVDSVLTVVTGSLYLAGAVRKILISYGKING